MKLSRLTAEEGQPKRKIIKSREDLMTRRWTKQELCRTGKGSATLMRYTTVAKQQRPELVVRTGRCSDGRLMLLMLNCASQL